MGKIVAVGGGDWQNLETLEIDREIKKLAEEPEKALLIPTAKEDSEEYQENFEKLYGEELGLETDSLLLYSDPSEKEVREIKKRLEGEETQSEIATDYGIYQSHVSMIKNGDAWRGVEL